MKVHEALAAELIPSGVDTIFTLVGDETVLFAAHASSRGVKLVAGRHESATVGMADGYFRVSGKVGVAVLARGPGLTNGLTAIICAARAGSGVVVVVGDSSLALAQLSPQQALAKDSGHKYVAQQRLLDAAMVPSITLRSPASAAADMRAALSWANVGATVVVNVPQDVMRSNAGEEPATVELPSLPAAGLPPTSTLYEVTELLMSHEKPVILAGRGAVRAGAGDDLRRLAKHGGALLATSVLAKGYFADEPFNVGISGGFASPVARELLAESDLLLAFGVSLNPLTVFDGQIFPRAEIVQIDNDPQAFGRFTPVGTRIVADARLAAAELADAVERESSGRIGYRTPDVAERIATFRWADQIQDQGTPGAIDPRLMMLRLKELLPERRTIVVDSGRQLTNPITYLPSADARSFVFPHDGGALGAAIGVGLGASIAKPDQLTVVCLGDGALMMSLTDLETAARYRLPMLIVVSNNGGYESEIATLRSEKLPGDAANFVNPSFESVARGVGVEGMTVRRIDDLDALPERLASLDGPLLLDCYTSSEIIPEWAELIAGLHRKQASV